MTSNRPPENGPSTYGFGVTDPNTVSYYYQKFTNIITAHSRLFNLGV